MAVNMETVSTAAVNMEKKLIKNQIKIKKLIKNWVSVEEMSPDKFLTFSLVLGFNFSARRLLTSSSAFSRSACEWKNDF